MVVMLERWNDDKMDALDAKVDGLGGQLREQRQDMREQRQETKAGFAKVDTELREQRQDMKAGFERIDDRFERLYHVLIGAAAAIVIALIGAPHL